MAGPKVSIEELSVIKNHYGEKFDLEAVLEEVKNESGGDLQHYRDRPITADDDAAESDDSAPNSAGGGPQF